MEVKAEQFDIPALVELMGRQRIAGRVCERVIAGQGFLEVHVPETSHNPKFTRFISPSAVYAINPIDDKTMVAYAESLRVKPIDAWDLSAFMKKVEEQKLLNGSKEDDKEEHEEEDYDQDYSKIND